MTEPHSISTWAKQDQETQLNAHTDIYIGKIIYRIIVAATKDQCTYLRREVSGNTSGEFVIPRNHTPYISRISSLLVLLPRISNTGQRGLRAGEWWNVGRDRAPVRR